MGSWRVLIANAVLTGYTGTELYTRDLALGLAGLDHDPVVFSPRLGPVADTLRAQGVEVIDRLDELSGAPDLIQGHHLAPTTATMLTFPDAAVVSVCHDATAWHSAPTPLSWVGRHVAVDEQCAERLRTEGIADDLIEVIPNAVDLDRFRPRAPLPPRPTRAAVFSNYARAGTHLDAVTEACERVDLPLDVIGSGAGTHTTRPEDLLGDYDVVFATGRSALEALAVGCAVVVCDTSGLGGMVTVDNVEAWRAWNYGRGLMDRQATPAGLMQEIGAYDATGNEAVRDFVRRSAGLEQWLQATTGVYEHVLANAPTTPTEPAVEAAAVVLGLGDKLQIARDQVSRRERALEQRRRQVDLLEQGAINRIIEGVKRRLPRPKRPPA